MFLKRYRRYFLFVNLIILYIIFLKHFKTKFTDSRLLKNSLISNNNLKINSNETKENKRNHILDKNEFHDILNYLYESQAFLIDVNLLKKTRLNDQTSYSSFTGTKFIHQFEIIENLFEKTLQDEIHTTFIMAFGIFSYLFERLNEVKN